jgi:hypothetical protein
MWDLSHQICSPPLEGDVGPTESGGEEKRWTRRIHYLQGYKVWKKRKDLGWN